MENARKLAALTFALLLDACVFDSPKTEPAAARNTFTDFQHVAGNVKGTWTKDKNPILISGDANVLKGDTLILKEGVILGGGYDIHVAPGAYLFVEGSDSLPVIVNYQSNQAKLLWGAVGNGGSFTVNGHARLSHLVWEYFQFTQTDTAASLEIDHGTFLHGFNNFLFFDILKRGAGFATQVVPVTIKNSLFVDPLDEFQYGAAVAFRTKEGSADTSMWSVDSNCFYLDDANGGSLSTFALSIPSGTYSRASWDGNGNMARLPDFVDFRQLSVDPDSWHRSDSVLITTVYDLHVKPGTPCEHMGAFAK